MHLPLVLPTRNPARLARPLNIAHRGASAGLPENTLSAIRGAVEHGADLIEVDVQRTKDGALVLMHDQTLVRTTDVQRVFPGRAPWRLAEFTYDELCRLDAGSWKGRGHAGEPVPRLDEVVSCLASSGVGLQLELKRPALYPGVVADLADALAPVLDAVDVVVQSFHFASMKELKARIPGIRVGLLGAPAREHLAVLATWADQVNPSHLAASRDYVDAVHDHGMESFIWTVDRLPAIRRALRLDVDGVITNRPDRLAAVLLQA